MDGVLIVDKPIGKTSFDIIREVRKEYNTKKVGHIGTLDPLASGVLPVLVGQTTKLSNYLMEHDKEYIATLSLGKQTNTGDSEGSIIKEMPVSDDLLDSTNIQKGLNIFLGESFQIPPMYSAIKINGKKLYELAREGKTIDRKPRKINISSIELLDVNSSLCEFTFKVTCSKGTYIRTLCEDIASKLDSCGYMKSLQRTRVGNFKIENAGSFIELENIFENIPKINVKNFDKYKNGMSIPLDNSIVNIHSGFGNAYLDNKYIGLCKIKNGYYKRFIIVNPQ